MRWMDMPPVWLAACVALTWISPWGVPWGPLFFTGMACLALAALLMLAAFVEFLRARTTIVPREAPSALITGGVYRITRNPIYLADVLILLGFALMWGRLLGIALVPVLAVVLDRRFIRGEETRLRDAFGAAFEAFARRTRRWIWPLR